MMLLLISDLQTFNGTHNYSTRDSDLLALPRYNMSASDNNIVFRGAIGFIILFLVLLNLGILFIYRFRHMLHEDLL